MKRKTHTLTMKDLLSRPIIRNDKMFEWMNKMTNEELIQHNKEVQEMKPKKNNDFFEMAHDIDLDILYNIFKMRTNETSKTL